MKRRGSFFFFILSFWLFSLGCQQKEQRDTGFQATPYKSTQPYHEYTITLSKKNHIHFPKDEGPHNNLIEWWYYTGHIFTTDGGHYTILFVLFKMSSSRSPLFYTAHVAIAPVHHSALPTHYQFEERAFTQPQNKSNFQNNREGFNFLIQNPVDIYHNLNFPLHKNAKLGGHPWHIQGKNGHDKIKAILTDGSYAVDIQATDEIGITQPNTGLFYYVNKNFPEIRYASYYYERPKMAIIGKIYDHGHEKKIQSGYLWFDHQWGDFLQEATSWRWFAILLEDNSAIMLYQLMTKKDAFVRVNSVFGFYLPACKAGACKPNQMHQTIPLTELPKDIAYWKSPVTNITYPIEWHLQVKKLGRLPALDLTIKNYFPNAEIDARDTMGPSYWEGPTKIEGKKNGRSIKGLGYAEIFFPHGNF